MQWHNYILKLTKQDYGTEWEVNGIDTNAQGQRVIEIVWHVERKAMIVTLAGVETIYGDSDNGLRIYGTQYLTVCRQEICNVSLQKQLIQ